MNVLIAMPASATRLEPKAAPGSIDVTATLSSLIKQPRRSTDPDRGGMTQPPNAPTEPVDVPVDLAKALLKGHARTNYAYHPWERGNLSVNLSTDCRMA